MFKPTCLQRSRRIRPERGRAERCGQLGSTVTFPSIRSKLMIAPDPLPSGRGVAASAGSRARGAGEEDAAAGSRVWAGGRSSQQTGSASWPARTSGGSGGGCMLVVSPRAGCPSWAVTVPSPVSPTHLGCPGHGTLHSPGLIPCAHAEELQPRRVGRRVGSPQRHSTGAGTWWEVGCWYSIESVHRLGGKLGKSRPNPHPDRPKKPTVSVSLGGE